MRFTINIIELLAGVQAILHHRSNGLRVLHLIAIIGMVTTGALAVAPQITLLSQSTLPRSGRLLIFGTNFGSTQGESQVLIGGIGAIATTWTDTEIHAYVPEATMVGTMSVKVVTATGSSDLSILDVTMRQSGVAAAGLVSRVRWRFQMDSRFGGQFEAVAPDGTVYASDLSRLYALTPDGGLLWVASAAGGRRPISVGTDGTIYTAGNLVKAISPDGTVLWQFPNPHPGADLTAGPSVGPDGNIYVVHNTWFGGIGTFSLDPDGNLRWADTLHSSTQGEGLSNAEIVFGPDRAIVGITPSNNLYVQKAVDFEGNELWYGGTGGLGLNAWTPPKLDSSGRIISSSGSISMQAITLDGNIEWVSSHPEGGSVKMPGIDSNGVIYTGSYLGMKLWAINPDGSTRWALSPSTSITDTLNVAPDGSVILAGGSNTFGQPGWLRAYDTADGTFLWQVDLLAEGGINQFVNSQQPTITSDSQTAYLTTVFLSDVGFSYLYAIRIGNQVVHLPGDINGDGLVNITDLLGVLGAWGPCPKVGACPADFDGNGLVDVSDLLIVLGNWG